MNSSATENLYLNTYRCSAIDTAIAELHAAAYGLPFCDKLTVIWITRHCNFNGNDLSVKLTIWGSALPQRRVQAEAATRCAVNVRTCCLQPSNHRDRDLYAHYAYGQRHASRPKSTELILVFYKTPSPALRRWIYLIGNVRDTFAVCVVWCLPNISGFLT